jgi:hypothetical protein
MGNQVRTANIAVSCKVVSLSPLQLSKVRVTPEDLEQARTARRDPESAEAVLLIRRLAHPMFA